MEASLGVLTQRFLQQFDVSDGVVDLKVAAEALGVQKRRIYDITNVLEGIGLVVKCSKNCVKWSKDSPLIVPNGAGPGDATAAPNAAAGATDLSADSRTEEIKAQHRVLKDELARIDDAIAVMDASLQSFANDRDAVRHAFLGIRELRELAEFAGKTMLVVRAPLGSKMEVPQPVRGCGSRALSELTILCGLFAERSLIRHHLDITVRSH
jgi:transcription factor E2F3